MSKKIYISHPTGKAYGRIAIPGSKSESNRVLLLKQLYFPDLKINGISDSSDTDILQNALENTSASIYTADAGTATRFMIAYCAAKEGAEVEISGTDRMHERPVGILVDALRELGADISYLQKEGFLPLSIKGKKLKGREIQMDAGVSSQFISAIMMIAPAMENGVSIRMKGFSVSAPYIYLTASIMRKMGFKMKVGDGTIQIEEYIPPAPDSFTIEPDWSSASYWFLIGLLANKTELFLPGFRQYSVQGDSFVSCLFEPLGLISHFIGAGFRLKKTEQPVKTLYNLNLIHNPDLAQTLAVAMVAKNICGKISGLQTLLIKETNRLLALKTELEKTGAEIEIGEDYLWIKKGLQNLGNIEFNSWGDHRMAMALAPLGLLTTIAITEPQVVEKSYKSFWKDLLKLGFEIKWV